MLLLTTPCPDANANSHLYPLILTPPSTPSLPSFLSYNASVYSANGSPSTFTGTGAAVVVSRLVSAMSGYEQQSVVFATANNGTLQGSYSLSSGAYATPPLPINASDATIAAALSLLPSVGHVLVRRQLGQSGAQLTLLVVFLERLVGVPMLVANAHGLKSSTHAAPTNIHASVNSLALARAPVLGSGYYNSTVVMVPAATPATTTVSQSGEAVLTAASALAPVTVRLEGLVEGLTYYVRVSAWNGAGDAYGAPQHGWPVLVVASSTPRAVTDVALTATR